MKRIAAFLPLVLLAACGGGSSPSPVVVATPTPAPPNAAVTATGNGALVIHPSASSAFSYGLEIPIRVRETAGGTADWNFARLQFFRGTNEIERTEVGADVIRSAGATRITANSDAAYRLGIRFNSDNFDSYAITLGFADVATGRQFTASVSPASFTDVLVSNTPLNRDSGSSTPAGLANLEASLARVRTWMLNR